MEQKRELLIPCDGARLEGDLVLPRSPIGLAIFAHGSGSSRHSPRNKFIAGALRKRNIGTLLFDLLTESEDRIYATRFDIQLLARRLVLAFRWIAGQPEVEGLPLGFFGASTGAAAALRAAAELGACVACIVSRGGRPDLAGGALRQVVSPTLLIVGGRDYSVLALNRESRDTMSAPRRLSIVEGASHLFEEPGTLEQAADLAGAWFEEHFSRASSHQGGGMAIGQ